MDMQLKVLNLIKKYGTNNPFKLAKKLNIEIIFDDLGEVRGLFKRILKRKFVFINSELSEFDQMLVCSHELGHAVLHASSNYQFLIDNTSILRLSKIENEANLFASYLLFPNDDFIESLDFIENKTNSLMINEMKRLREII
jgi:hypothetical protein